jgi:acylphosphatase
MSPVQRHLIIHGTVQGVGYRWSMAQAAEALGVRGWVRNRRDGTVEALAVGDAAAVEALLQWAQRGPPQARVDRVDVLPSEPGPMPEGFEQRATAG